MWRIKYWIQEENFLSSSAMKIRIFLFFVGWTNPSGLVRSRRHPDIVRKSFLFTPLLVFETTAKLILAHHTNNRLSLITIMSQKSQVINAGFVEQGR